MDELELLKKDWQKKEEHLPKLSFDEIYKMIWKKSSSIVKWIFYISIAEFVFWIAMLFIPFSYEKFEGENSEIFNNTELILNIISFGAILFFIFKFYQNYKKISATDSAKALMKKIISTRKIVMQYVWFNVILFAVSFILLTTEIIIYDPVDLGLTEKIAAADSKILIWTAIAGITVVTILIFCTLLWLFYRLIYGILLKKLNANYSELKKLEV
ncbi:hypothetical protein ACFSQJ_15070 [Croceitalea marina]|uniref:Uncharacterized protein n=1 Tax=Croceitalea marina TaxID=1775166 RepID=A0ABW5MY57_9FLAO